MADEPLTQEERERALLALLLALLMADIDGHIQRHVEDLGAGRTDVGGFGAAMAATLLYGHSHAAYAGRRRAGVPGSYGDADAAFGAAVMVGQQGYLDAFLADIEGGRYTDDAGALRQAPIAARAALYGHRLRGTAHEAWALAADPDTPVWWDLGSNENHCPSCPALAEGSPYTASTLPAYPGDGSTECTTNCWCSLREGAPDGPAVFERVEV